VYRPSLLNSNFKLAGSFGGNTWPLRSNVAR
jgi:hypothetical protein